MNAHERAYVNAPAIGWGTSRGLVVTGTWEAWATLSSDGSYRYALGRQWLSPIDAPAMVWVMLNPSTADHLEDDPTIRKCIGFAKRAGCCGIVVVNLFAYRATNPRDLRIPRDPDGPHNTDAIKWALTAPQLGSVKSVLVAGWGRAPRRPVARALNEFDFHNACGCYGTTEREPKEPRHPLMLPYASPFRQAGEW